MQTTSLGDVTFAYEFIGEGNQTIVLLNGIAMSIGHWTPIVDSLSSDYRCLLHDFRGQLLSDKPPGPYSLEQHADDVAGLLDAVGIESAHILGTSYGAEVGMIMAYRHPDRVRSLVVVDGASETSPVLCAAVHAWRAAALGDPVVFYRTMIPWNYSTGYLNLHIDELRDRESRVAELPREYFVAFAELCDAFLNIEITPHLEEIDCPTLVVVGERDILKPRRFSEIIHSRIEGSVLTVIEGAGHAVVVEQPAKVSALAKEFFRRVDT
jgi:pimeloyl-ACP methyl ester carboxylesterase